MIKGLHHTAISVSNLDQSIHFYCDLLGMTLEWRMDHRQGEVLDRMTALKGVDLSVAMLSGWGSRIELLQYHFPLGQPYPKNKPQCDNGIIHIAFEVDDVASLYEKLLSQGVRFNAPPQITRPGVEATYFHDPDGVTIEMIQYSHGEH